VGKAIVATLVLAEIDRGGVGIDTPVAEVWPEFGRHGKEWVTIGHALSHRAAVPAIRETLTDDDLFDWETMTSALADTAPWWAPDTRHAYHTNTFGHLVGGIVHHITGDTPGDILRPLADALGADIWFGVPADQHERCARVIWDSDLPASVDTRGLDGDALMNVLAHFNPPGYSSVGLANTPEWRSAQIPAAGGHGTARGIARFYAGLLDPGRVLSEPLLDRATQPASSGPCPLLGEDLVFGLGFVPTTQRRPYGPNPGAFGHFGTGGSVGFADPVSGIAFGYAMNHVRPRWQSSRNRALIDTLYDVLP
jgi:CubicO group peptidase (beta-lactamase class C family)